MNMKRRLSVLFILALCIFFTACESKPATSEESTGAESSTAQESSGTVATSEDMPKGIVPIEEWEGVYPEYVASFKENEEMSETTYGGSVQVDYLEKYPYLNAMYEGYGFSKQYDRARGHIYALEDVKNTARPKAGASCLACKVSQFEEALKADPKTSAMDFEQFTADNITVGFTCYDCHGETPGAFNPNRAHFLNAMEANKDLAEIIPEKQTTCSQCHVEYYMDTETKDVALPWTGGLGADEAYAYYQEDGFADWEHPSTGAKLLKAQHPETETFYGSVHQEKGLTCMDCHMPKVETEDGKKISSHHWTSPLKNPEASCLKCHADQDAKGIVALAESVQKPVVEKTDAVGAKLEAFIKKLTEVKDGGSLSEDELKKLQEQHRESQFFFDYVFVENSEGFHNNTKMMEYLDKAEKIIDEGMKTLESK